MSAKSWATRSLQGGDLTALAFIASGLAQQDEGRIDRLQKRGFVMKQDDGPVAVTFLGRLALLIKRLTFR